MAIGPGLHNNDPSDESLNLAMSDKARPLYDAVVDFINTEVEPLTGEYHRLGEIREDLWGYHPEQLEILEKLKALSGLPTFIIILTGIFGSLDISYSFVS